LNTTNRHWYAIRIFSARHEVLNYLDGRGIETYIPMLHGRPLLASLVFLRCTEHDILAVKNDWYSGVMVYRNADRTHPQAIPDAEMENFRMVLNIKGQEFIPIEVHDPQFLAGQRVRVLDGPLKGAVGVIKRIKGDRRLVVSVTGIAAVATTFVHPELLEAVNEELI